MAGARLTAAVAVAFRDPPRLTAAVVLHYLQDRTGRTALHWAAECNQVEAAKTLLEYGADVRAQECMGRSVVELLSAVLAAAAVVL